MRRQDFPVPDVTLRTPANPDEASAFLNIRDIAAVY